MYDDEACDDMRLSVEKFMRVGGQSANQKS